MRAARGGAATDQHMGANGSGIFDLHHSHLSGNIGATLEAEVSASGFLRLESIDDILGLDPRVSLPNRLLL